MVPIYRFHDLEFRFAKCETFHQEQGGDGWQHLDQLQRGHDRHLKQANFHQVCVGLKRYQLAPTYDEIKLAIKRGGLIYVTPAHTSLFTPVVDCLDGTCIPLRSPQTILMACLWEQDTGSPCRPMATSPMCFSPSNKIRFSYTGPPLKVSSTKKLI